MQMGGDTADQEPKCFAPDFEFTENEAPDNTCTNNGKQLGYLPRHRGYDHRSRHPTSSEVEITLEEGKRWRSNLFTKTAE